jgi:hypothetical protein
MSSIQTVSIEVPIYDMEEFDTYIDRQIKDYKDYLVVQLDDDSGYYDDRDIAHTKMLIDHYEDILTGLRSTYTDKNGSLRDEFLDLI